MSKKCNNCNAVYSANDKYCPNCGHSNSIQQNESNNYVFCSKCGQRNSSKYNFCSNCATPLFSKVSSEPQSSLSINKLILKIILIFGSIIAIVMCINKIVELNVLRDDADFHATWSLIHDYEDKIDMHDLSDEEQKDLRIVSERLVDAIESEIYSYWTIVATCCIVLIIGFIISPKQTTTDTSYPDSYDDVYLDK